MAISFLPPSSPTLNKSETFTASGSWTVPDGVTFAFVELVGGQGLRSGNPAPTGNVTVQAGDGGDTSAFGVTAVGGLGGRARHLQTNSPSARYGLTEDGRQGERVALFVDTTPGATETITIGAGGQGRVTISWVE